MVVQTCTTATCPLCPAGKYLKSALSCQCSPCPNNTFTNKPNNASKCQQCTKDCPKSKIIGKKCTRSQDAVCECPKGQFFDTGVLFCIDCTICPVGQGTIIKCATESNTDCKPCVQGKTYSNSTRMGPCDTCSSCSGLDLFVKEPCNSTKNTICETRNIYYPSSTSKTPKIPVITKKETLSTTKSKSHRPKTKAPITIIVLVVVAVVVVLFILGICICCFRQRRHKGHERSLDDDVEEEVKLQENREEKSYPQHSGLRGRHVRNPRRLEQNRRKLADPSASSEDHQLLNSDGLLREAPYDFIEQLALLLNPRSLNNWARLAGKLGYSKEKVEYFGMDPDNATQRMLSDWMTSNASTIKVLHRHLKSISRDDAAAILEV